MKNFTKIGAQGDILFRALSEKEVEDIRKTSTKVEPENGVYILAHSETGHHHVIAAGSNVLERIPSSNLPEGITACLLVMNEPGVLEHIRSFDTHEPILFEKGAYEIRRQREYTPQGLRQVAD